MDKLEQLYAICQSDAKVVQTAIVLEVLDELTAKISDLESKLDCEHDFVRKEYISTIIGTVDIRKCKKCGWEKDFGDYCGK